MSSILTIAGAVTAIATVAGLVLKWYFGRERKVAKAREDALNNGKTAVENGDTSGVTAAFDDLHRLR